MCLKVLFMKPKAKFKLPLINWSSKYTNSKIMTSRNSTDIPILICGLTEAVHAQCVFTSLKLPFTASEAFKSRASCNRSFFLLTPRLPRGKGEPTPQKVFRR